MRESSTPGSMQSLTLETEVDPVFAAPAAVHEQPYVLYVYAADHGTGAGPALLEAVVDQEESVALWVADPNPRAQAFYRKHGFVADGVAQVGRVKRSWPQADGARRPRLAALAWADGGSSDLAS